MKAFLVAGTHSGSGKTTITIALMRAIAKRGWSVAPFKAGPDYIDPEFHTVATGTSSCNLDSWMLDRQTLSYLYRKNGAESDIAIVEGVMGLYDGCGDNEEGSTAQIAKWLGLPVLLVVDAKGISRSIAAQITGYMNFDREINLAGVILNNVSGERHFQLLKTIIEKETTVQCFGYFPLVKDNSFKSRHLGLLPAGELAELTSQIDRLADCAETYINIDALLRLEDSFSQREIFDRPLHPVKAPSMRIAIARDNAFHFYYQDNLRLMQESGITLVEFSPLGDKRLPDNIDGIYIGGGFPEVWAGQLSQNRPMRESIRKKIEASLPLYAECGGLMYLTRGITTADGHFHPMVGFFDCGSVMTPSLQRFGYVEIRFEEIEVRAHEFHYSKLIDTEHERFSYEITRTLTADQWQCGLRKKNVLAGYPHVHFYANRKFYEKIVGLYMRRNE